MPERRKSKIDKEAPAASMLQCNTKNQEANDQLRIRTKRQTENTLDTHDVIRRSLR